MKKVSSLILGIVLILINFSFTLAYEDESSTTLTPIRPKQAERKVVAEARCTVAESRIDFRIDKFSELRDEHRTNYERIKNALKEFADKLDSQGYDTAKIREDYKTLDAKIVKRAADYTTFITKLKVTKDFACGESEGDFLNALKEARSALQVVRQDSLDIRNFYINTIRPDIKALKAQKQ